MKVGWRGKFNFNGKRFESRTYQDPLAAALERDEMYRQVVPKGHQKAWKLNFLTDEELKQLNITRDRWNSMDKAAKRSLARNYDDPAPISGMIKKERTYQRFIKKERAFQKKIN